MALENLTSIDDFIDALWLEEGLSKNIGCVSAGPDASFSMDEPEESLAGRDHRELVEWLLCSPHGVTKATFANRRLSVFKRYFGGLANAGSFADPTSECRLRGKRCVCQKP